MSKVSRQDGTKSDSSRSSFLQKESRPPFFDLDHHSFTSHNAIQTKSNDHASQDKEEIEADQLAEKVMRGTNSNTDAQAGSDTAGLSVQRKCESCQHEEEEKVQKKDMTGSSGANGTTSGGDAGESADGNSPQSIIQSLGRGRPLDSYSRGKTEPVISADFSGVEVHTDSTAIRLSQELNARAFTVGNHIAFGEEQHQPGSIAGDTLMAHELAHVKQQDASIRDQGQVMELGGIQKKIQKKGTGGIKVQRCGGSAKTIDKNDAGIFEQYRTKPKEEVFNELRKVPPGSLYTTENLALLSKLYPDPNSDEHWMAERILHYGKEINWPDADLAERARRSDAGKWAEPPDITALGTSKGGRPVNSFFFPGVTSRHAMIVSGVHGSELSGVEVVETLIAQLQTGSRPYYSVILVPRLFPDNIATAEADPANIENSELNVGRITNPGKGGKGRSVEPQRQMPGLGKAFDSSTQLDSRGRKVEPENIMLLELIEKFKPARIASIHSHHNAKIAGIYADPRADWKSHALGFDSDKKLALKMAQHAQDKGAHVPGNKLEDKKTDNDRALYAGDDSADVSRGLNQPRDLKEDKPEDQRGVSLGGWGSTAVCDPSKPAANRPAMRIITVEMQKAYRIQDYKTAAEQADRKVQVDAEASALREIFLGNNEAEAAENPCDVITPPPAPAKKKK